LGIALRVSQALAYAHARGVIHRDLKPQNIMVADFDEVLLMDWGVSQSLQECQAAARSPAPGVAPEAPSIPVNRQPQMGGCKGTPAYMAPEQAQGRVGGVDPRSDVFGLGAVLGHILTGEPPYAGVNQDDVLDQAAKGDTAAVAARLKTGGIDWE